MTTPPRLPLAVLDASAFLRWAALARSSFANARAEIDALNVFPVPDGDTGTNLYLTLDSAPVSYTHLTLPTSDLV